MRNVTILDTTEEQLPRRQHHPTARPGQPPVRRAKPERLWQTA